MKKTSTLLFLGSLVCSIALILIALSFSSQVYAAPTIEPNAQSVASTSSSTDFIALTQLPAIKDAASAEGFSNFLNQFYKILIGLGAVLAVLMIMYAGVQFMTSRGSVSSNEAAKSRIQNAVLGLILILSPTIVFSIINPDILNLNLDIRGPQPEKLQYQDTSSTSSNGIPLADTSFNGPVKGVVTGSLLKTGIFPTEAELNTFVAQCSATANGTKVDGIAVNGATATSKGCTRPCSPAGKGSCDVKACSQYTAFCGVYADNIAYKDAGKWVPPSISEHEWNTFTEACVAKNGNPVFKSNGKTTYCLGPNDQAFTCAQGSMTCTPK